MSNLSLLETTQNNTLDLGQQTRPKRGKVTMTRSRSRNTQRTNSQNISRNSQMINSQISDNSLKLVTLDEQGFDQRFKLATVGE